MPQFKLSPYAARDASELFRHLVSDFVRSNKEVNLRVALKSAEMEAYSRRLKDGNPLQAAFFALIAEFYRSLQSEVTSQTAWSDLPGIAKALVDEFVSAPADEEVSVSPAA
jgi:hypothetical protein